LRVALRRTRVMLELARCVFGRFRCDRVRRALRDIQRATGELRDEEVILGLAETVPQPPPDVESWLALHRRRERSLRRALVRRIEAGDLERARHLLDALLAFGTDPSRDQPLGRFAGRSIARARRRVERRRRARLDDPHALHELRLGYKRLRYVAEALTPTPSLEQASLAQTASRMQSRLGSVHDIDVTVACIRRARSLCAETKQRLLGALESLRQERVTAYVSENERRARDTSPHDAGGNSLRKTSTR